MPNPSRSARLFFALLAAAVAGCGAVADRADAPAARFSDNPTPYQTVLALIDAGSHMPEAGDDLTLYLHEPPDDAARPVVRSGQPANPQAS